VLRDKFGFSDDEEEFDEVEEEKQIKNKNNNSTLNRPSKITSGSLK
jgi:hypothetical protein